MEEELAAQRDAAIAVTRELQKQLQLERETLARTFERRALTAERLRLRAEVAQRRAASASSWERRACGRLLSLSLFLGAAGALVGWSFGLLALLMGLEPVLGFLLVLPGMAIGTLLGLAVAKTKAEMEERSRREQQEREDAHSEAEMAALDGEQPEKEEQDAAADDDAIKDQELQSWTAAGLGLAWRTTRTAVGLAAGLVSGSDPAQRVFQAPPPADADRKRQ